MLARVRGEDLIRLFGVEAGRVAAISNPRDAASAGDVDSGAGKSSILLTNYLPVAAVKKATGRLSKALSAL